MFGETIIDMPIDGKSTLGTVSKRLEYNVHESFGYLTGDYLVTIGGTEGTETYVEYIGAGTNIHPGRIQYSCKLFVLEEQNHFCFKISKAERQKPTGFGTYFFLFFKGKRKWTRMHGLVLSNQCRTPILLALQF